MSLGKLYRFITDRKKPTYNKGCSSNAQSYAGDFNTWGNGDNISIGESVSFGGNVFIYDTAPVIIGDHTMIGYGVIIHTSTHDYAVHPMWLKRIDRPVHIGKHVWIGAGVIVLPGVKIGDYSVIGAGSVIGAHVPSGAIVAGNPAKIQSYRNLEHIENLDVVPDYPNNATIVMEGFLADDKRCRERDKNK